MATLDVRPDLSKNGLDWVTPGLNQPLESFSEVYDLTHKRETQASAFTRARATVAVTTSAATVTSATVAVTVAVSATSVFVLASIVLVTKEFQDHRYIYTRDTYLVLVDT